MNPIVLRTFLAVARTRNITRAAKDVHLAQSSVSDQMQSLENDLQTNLFIRSRAGLELTEAGMVLKEYAEQIIALSEEARAAVATTTSKTRGILRIGALETIASGRLSHWLPSFQKNHPELTLQIKVAGSDVLLEKLESDEVDVVFCFARAELDGRFIKRVMSPEPLVLIAAPAQSRNDDGLAIADIVQQPFVVTEKGCIYRHLFDSAFADADVGMPTLAAEVGSIGSIIAMVAAGSGYGLVPRLAAADAINRGDIVEMAWPGHEQTASLDMVWRRRRAQPPPLAKLLAAEAAKGLSGTHTSR